MGRDDMKMKNKRRSAKHKIFYTILLVLTILLVAGCQKKMTVQDYLDLGEKYLTEANYEEAIVAFTKAIEVEPKALKAYEGLTNAYIKTENYEKAQEVLQSGISVYERLTEEEKTDEFKRIYVELLKLEEKIRQYLDAENSSDMEENENETFAETDSVDAEQERLIAEAKEKYGSILEQVIAEINSQDPTYTHYFTDDFKSFAKGLEKPLVWQQEDGNYLGLYVGTDGDVYVYLGEMDKGIRSGSGSWYGEYTEEGVTGVGVFFGNWLEDYPNGSGTEIDVFEDNMGEQQEKRQGNYQNGYENGSMQDIGYFSYEEGHYHSTATYNVTNGMPHILYNQDGDQIVAECNTDVDDDMEEYLIYEEGEIWGVDGAMKN